MSDVITDPVLLANFAPYWIGVTVPLPTLPIARSSAEAAPKLYAPPALLDPVPTTDRPSAAAPVPDSARYQPAGRMPEGEVLLLNVLKFSETPVGDVIEIKSGTCEQGKVPLRIAWLSSRRAHEACRRGAELKPPPPRTAVTASREGRDSVDARRGVIAANGWRDALFPGLSRKRRDAAQL